MIRDVHFCCTRQKPFVKNDDSIYLLKYTVPPLIWPGRNEEKLRKMKNKFRVYTERSNFLTTCIKLGQISVAMLGSQFLSILRASIAMDLSENETFLFKIH